MQFLRATLSGAHSSHERELAEEGLEEVADPATGAVVFRCKSPGADADETVQAKAGVGHYLLQQKTDGKGSRSPKHSRYSSEWLITYRHTVFVRLNCCHLLLSPTERSAIRDVQKQYQEWVQRMKVPPRLERDPLDLAWPAELLQGARRPGADGGDEPRQRAAAAAAATGSGKGQRGTVATHPAGPMLDVSLAECLEIHDYERIALEHFRVFDCRIRD